MYDLDEQLIETSKNGNLDKVKYLNENVKYLVKNGANIHAPYN